MVCGPDAITVAGEVGVGKPDARAFAAALEAAGATSGGTVMVGDSLRVHTVDAALERLQRLARRKRPDDKSAVDAFIAERRNEAERE